MELMPRRFCDYCKKVEYLTPNLTPLLGEKDE